MNLHFGVDYYPEHWPPTRWETDARLMQQMGVQLVRMAEFSWHKLEPTEGQFDFAWLDDAITLLGSYGIKTVLGTPTAAPPAWLINRYPEILPIDREGRVRGFGGRHHDCQSNPVYRQYVKKIVSAMADHYAENPNVVGWQPDNELGNSHGDLCTCDSCRAAFQNWLEKKYHTVAALNRAWGTAFWSQEYNTFAEVFPPRITVTGENPSALLDWKRFHSDLIVDFFVFQAALLPPHQFITHNFMGFADTVNYYDLAKKLDFVSHDQYPSCFCTEQPQVDPAALAAALDVVRSYKDKSFWIMEQQSGPTGWQTLGRTPAPGQLALWTLQSIAHGADGVVYFRWRACAMGTEQYWHGILPHSGIPGRRYDELKNLTAALLPLMEQMQGSLPKAEAGILFSFEQGYALDLQPHHPALRYTGQVLAYHKALYQRQIPTDFVPPERDFSRYKLLIAPLQYLMTPEWEDKLFAYVKNGGVLVLTMRTGVKDADNLCMTELPLPGRLAELTGATVPDYDCLRDTDVGVQLGGQAHRGSLWADILEPAADTEVLARYTSEFYAGSACITRHRYGRGCCYYVGTAPNETLLAALAADWEKQAGLTPLGTADAGVELTARENETTRWLFALNHTGQAAGYQLPQGYTLCHGTTPGRLAPYEGHILEKKA